MKASTLLALSKKIADRPYSEIAEIIDGIPPYQIELIQDALDSDSPVVNVAAKEIAANVLDARLSRMVPHEICPSKHFSLSRPILGLALVLHRRCGVHPIASKYTIAFTLVFSGAYAACNPMHGIPHFIWDALAYTVHGIGAAPIAEAIIKRASRIK